MAGLDDALRSGEQSAHLLAAGQVDIFGHASEPYEPPRALKPIQEWSRSQRLAGERETLGLYLTGHPIAPYEADLRCFASGRIADFALERPAAPVDSARGYMDARSVTLAGLILEVRRRGPRVSFMLDDRSGRMEITLFEEVYQRHRDLIVKDTLVQVEGALRFDEFGDAWRLSAKQLTALEAVRERLARALLLRWPRAHDVRLIEQLQELLAGHRGGQCAVLLRYQTACASGVLSFGPEWKVRVTSRLLEQLEGLLGEGCAQLRYAIEAATTEAVG